MPVTVWGDQLGQQIARTLVALDALAAIYEYWTVDYSFFNRNNAWLRVAESFWR